MTDSKGVSRQNSREITVVYASNIREIVKTIIVLRQEPPFCKKTGGLFMYPPSPPLPPP